MFFSSFSYGREGRRVRKGLEVIGVSCDPSTRMWSYHSFIQDFASPGNHFFAIGDVTNQDHFVSHALKWHAQKDFEPTFTHSLYVERVGSLYGSVPPLHSISNVYDFLEQSKGKMVPEQHVLIALGDHSFDIQDSSRICLSREIQDKIFFYHVK